jgi:hypothetical protein
VFDAYLWKYWILIFLGHTTMLFLDQLLVMRFCMDLTSQVSLRSVVSKVK